MWKDILEYYKNLLIVQYKTKSKARDTIALFTDCSICEGLPLQLKDAFNLGTASGEQLTILGKIIGIPRNVIGLDLVHRYFSFTRYLGTPDSYGFDRFPLISGWFYLPWFVDGWFT